MVKKVLIIAYYFPPVGGGGVQRTAKFVKYLPEFGWKPVVLTVKEKVYRKKNRPSDATLLDDIPKGVQVVRTNSIDLANIFRAARTQDESNSSKLPLKSLINKIGGSLINPDAQMLWIPIAVKTGFRLIKNHKIDTIFSTANPWSDHIVGGILKSLTRLPWVADYRDMWNLNPYITHSSIIRENIQLFLEKKVIKNADQVILTTEKAKENYTKVFGGDKFVTIQNGFDQDDLVSIKPKKFSKFTFVYSGTYWDYKRPYNFILAVSNWLKKCPHVRQELMINFLGAVDEETKSLIDKKGLWDVIKCWGYLSHKESIAFLLGADALLLTLDEGGELMLAVAGKIFEYLASGKPVLALVPSSSIASDILRKEGRGEYIVSPRDVESIENRIMALHTKYKNGCLPIYPVENLQAYTRKNATKKLSRLLVDLKQCTR